jgi:hypothetical protein
VAVFLESQDDGGGDRAVVEETLEPGEPSFDELPQRRGDLDVPASDVESHNRNCQLAAVSFQPDVPDS